MDKFVKQYCHGNTGILWVGSQRIADIKYRTGTRAYRVSYIRKRFPKAVDIFGRWAKIIYNVQSARQKQTSNNIPRQEIRQMGSETD